MKNNTLGIILIVLLLAMFLPALLGLEPTEPYYGMVALGYLIFIPWASIRLSK